MREAFDALPSAALIVSRAGTLLRQNAAAAESFGERVVGRPLSDLSEPLAALARRAIADRLTAAAVVDLPSARARVRAVASPLLAPGGVRGAVLRLDLLEERLDVEALAAGLAHEIRNPLAGLKGAAELLRDELPEDSPLRAYPELIAREARRVDGLVGALLDLSRPPELLPASENIHEICDEALLISRPLLGASVRVERRYDPSLPDVELDRERVLQVLLNLVKNAAEAMEGGPGTIVVETGVAPGMRVRVGESVRKVLRVAILDEGPGLPEELEPFTPFATTKPAGTGLGLVVSRRIAEAHGGRLELRDRREGHGVEASLLLPL